MTDILEYFAYLTHPDGTRFQVLMRDEDGNPIDTDMEATAAAYAAHDAELERQYAEHKAATGQAG